MSARDPAYLAWVRQQPCVISGKFECVAHHLIGHGRLSSAKVSDYQTMPLGYREHDSLHRLGWKVWERLHGDQRGFVLATLCKAVESGYFAPGTSPHQILGQIIESPPERARKPRTKAKFGGGKVKRESPTATPSKVAAQKRGLAA